MYIGMSNNVTFHTAEVAGTLFLSNLSNSEIRIMTYGRTTISCHHGWLVGSGNPIGSFFLYNLYVYTYMFRFMFISLFTNQGPRNTSPARSARRPHDTRLSLVSFLAIAWCCCLLEVALSDFRCLGFFWWVLVPPGSEL